MMEVDLRVEVVIDAPVQSPIDVATIRDVVMAAARDQGFGSGELGVRITDDAAIHRVNVDHLGHDYPTDVISFDYGSGEGRIDGEMIVSAETAERQASEGEWPVAHELMLYLVHGTLHIAGLDDRDAAERERMRAAEQRVLRSLGVEPIVAFAADPREEAT
jgi:probable rRNA maturation factor